ncbi:hypothetical protein [Rhodanobacter thiooxydans]|jgi:hypothetical protein|uniref:hypothetical protein n=1 Tax=Rhodanobacter thiooxydans TaxID=416169 RepID=UPI0009DA492F|nr:hypothetical protein [Rhodanobacter thiooxydans]
MTPLDVVHVGRCYAVSPQPRRACSASASALRFAWHPLRHAEVVSLVQAACPERAMPMAWQALAGVQAAHRAAPPGHRVPVPSGRGKMQGKIEGCGTTVRTKPVCTWGWRGTRRYAAPCCESAQGQARAGDIACLPPAGAMVLDGACR